MGLNPCCAGRCSSTMFQKVLETLVMTKPYIENVASGIVANPFGI